MQKIRRPLLILHHDPRFRELLRGAARRDFDLLPVEGWPELLEEVRSASASALVVVDPYHATPASRREPSPELAALLHQFPSVSVVAAMHTEEDCSRELRRLGEWGVVQVVALDEEPTPVAVAHRLHGAKGRPLRRLVERVLPDQLGGPARAILGVATQVVTNGGQGSDLARELNITSRTLLRWCKRSGLPAPKQLLAWMRMLLAAELLDDPGRTVGDVASACGYAADSSLRHAVHRFVGLTPTALRERGAFAVVAGGFVGALEEARGGRARYRRRKRR